MSGGSRWSQATASAVAGQLREYLAARTLPHALRRADVGDDTLVELEMLVGHDDDLAGEATRISNRIRGLLTQIHPALERVLGPKVAYPAVLELLSRCGGPAGLRKAGRRKLTAIAVTHAPRVGPGLVEQILSALDERTVTVAGTQVPKSVVFTDSLPRTASGKVLKSKLRETPRDDSREWS